MGSVVLTSSSIGESDGSKSNKKSEDCFPAYSSIDPLKLKPDFQRGRVKHLQFNLKDKENTKNQLLHLLDTNVKLLIYRKSKIVDVHVGPRGLVDNSVNVSDVKTAEKAFIGKILSKIVTK